jgi:hypothetical protein
MLHYLVDGKRQDESIHSWRDQRLETTVNKALNDQYCKMTATLGLRFTHTVCDTTFRVLELQLPKLL